MSLMFYQPGANPLSAVLARCRTRHRQRTGDHRAQKSAEQRETCLSRHPSFEQQRARDRHAIEAIKESGAPVLASWRSTAT